MYQPILINEGLVLCQKTGNSLQMFTTHFSWFDQTKTTAQIKDLRQSSLEIAFIYMC